jgi:hypothetical protein
MLDRSNIMFNDFISGIPSRQIYQNATAGANPPRRLSRTNPINKAKALDLHSQQGGLTPDRTSSKKGGDHL